jgi:hypothetical protein
MTQVLSRRPLDCAEANHAGLLPQFLANMTHLTISEDPGEEFAIRGQSKKRDEPKTYGEAFIKPESGEEISEQVPSRPDERLSENLPDTQKH